MINESALRARYATFVLVSAVLTVFCIAIAALLVRNFTGQPADPLTVPSYVQLKEALRAEPDNDGLKTRIRDLDVRLRGAYFRSRQFSYYGTYLLLGGVVLAIASAKAAAGVHRRLPQPLAEEVGANRDLRWSRQALAGVAGLAVLLGVSVAALRFSHHSELSRDVLQLAAVPAAQPGQEHLNTAASDAAGNPAPAKPAVPEESAAAPAQPAPQPAPQQAAAAAMAAGPEAFLQNWPRFRGPHGSGVFASADVPTKWQGAEGEGIAWKSPVPLPGNNSPIVWGDAIFLTGADEKQREVYCFDAGTGSLRWKWQAPPKAAAAEPLEVSEDTGFAAPTAATDGSRVFAMFAQGDLVALDIQGNQVWLREFEAPKNSYGHASSLVVAAGRLLLQFDQGAKNDKLSKMLALDPATGKSLWEMPREVPNSWSTPIVVEHQDRRLVITCADPWAIAYNLEDGQEVWRCKCLRQDVGPSPVAAGELVIIANEFPGVSAIKLGGQGDVSESHVAWSVDAGAPDTCSPLVVGDLLLLQASYGTLTCYDVQQGGDPLWEEDFEENFRSSPSLAGDQVYLFSETGKSWVIRASREKCERLAENDLGEECVTSPAFKDGRIYIRGKEHLFCLAAAKK